MEEKRLQELLRDVADGRMTPQEAAERLKTLPYDDLGFAKVDTHRQLRQGRAEVVFGIGKTPEQVAGIVKRLADEAPLVIATKVEEAHAAVTGETLGREVLRGDVAVFIQAENETKAGAPVLEKAVNEETNDESNGTANDRAAGSLADKAPSFPHGLTYFEVPKMLVWRGAAGSDTEDTPESNAEALSVSKPDRRGLVAVVCAGTADIPIAEEAALTAALYGCRVSRFTDVGVAGIHRLLDQVEEIRKADAIIAVAGMEGALASVVGGLVAVPVIAVPTSIGYGASLGGLTALFAMLNSCSLGVSVMNIDNGFGAGYLASLIASRR